MDKTSHRFLQHNSFEPLPIGDESIDLMLTSPPYPMVHMWDDVFSGYDPSIGQHLLDNMGSKAFERMHQLLDKTWSETFRVLKPGGFACINIGDATRTIEGNFRLYSNHSRVLSSCHDIGFDILPSIIWRKPTNAPNKFMGSGMLPAGAYVTLEHEMILILRKGGKRVFSKDESVLRKTSTMFWEERNLFFSDLWTDVTGTRQKMHIDSLRKRSAAFPIDIPLRLIQMYSQYGDVVLDPFSGTGTTCHAAIALARSSVNIDADEDLLNASSKLPTRHATKKELNAIVNKRLDDHINFIQSKDMLFFRYKNEPIGLPVKTLQEKSLNIFPIQSITRNDREINVQYRNYTKIELEEFYNALMNTSQYVE